MPEHGRIMRGMNGEPEQTTLVLEFDRGTLLLSGSGGKAAVDASGGIWAWDCRVSAWRCDAIHYPRVYRDLADQFGPRFHDDMPKPARVFWP